VRSLTVEELLEAISVKPFSLDRDKRNKPTINMVLNSCAGLIIIATANNTVHFGHYTIQEWLESQQFLSSYILSEICLTYLNFKSFESGPFETDDVAFFAERLREYPLLHYAACNWTAHMKSDVSNLRELTQKLFGSQSSFDVMRQVRYAVKSEGIWSLDKYPRESSPCHFMVREGMSETQTGLVLNSALSKVLQPDSYKRTLLHEACAGQHLDIVQKLLQLMPDIVNDADKDGQTALHYAAAAGNREIIDALAHAKADPLQVDSVSCTPYQRARFSGQEVASRDLLSMMFERLKKSHDKSGPKPYHGYTLLHQVAALGYEDGLPWLFEEANADPYALTTTLHETPLHQAAVYGHAGVVRTLISNMEISKVGQNVFGALPLHIAAKFGRKEVVDILVDVDVSGLFSRDFLGFTPLHWAAAGGSLELVEELFPCTEINLLSEANIPNPYHLASWGNNLEVMQYIKEKYSLSDDTFSETPDSVFTPKMFYALADGAKRLSESLPTPTALLCFLCRYMGERQVTRENYRAASIWFDLEFIISDPSDEYGTVYCDRCVTRIVTKERYKCVCMQCTLSPGGSYDLCTKCFKNAFNPTIGVVHYRFVKVPSTSTRSLEERLSELKSVLQVKDYPMSESDDFIQMA
jgi:ankyrin repeat protein